MLSFSFTTTNTYGTTTLDLFPDNLGYVFLIIGFYYLYLAREIFKGVFNLCFWLFGLFLLATVVLKSLVTLGFSCNWVSYEDLGYLVADFAMISLCVLGYEVARKYLKSLVKAWFICIVLSVLSLCISIWSFTTKAEGDVYDVFVFLKGISESSSLYLFWFVFFLFFAVLVFVVVVFAKTHLQLKGKADKYGKFFGLVVLLYVAYLFSSYFYNSQLVEQQKLIECQDTQAQTDKDMCYYSIGGEYMDLSYCDRISDQLQKDNCYAVVGQEGSDPAVCSKIVNQAPKDICYLNVAQHASDSKLCANVVEESLKTLCNENTQ